MHSPQSNASRLVLTALALAGALSLAGCHRDDIGGPGIAGTAVRVRLMEFSVTPERTSAPEGIVNFHVTNAGTEEHEFLVIKTDLAPNALPREANGSYQENGPGTTLVDELGSVQPGSSLDLTLNLLAGNYVLICNRVEGSESHYARGMRAAFRVD